MLGNAHRRLFVPDSETCHAARTGLLVQSKAVGKVNDDKAAEAPRAIDRAGHKTWERIILGENSVEGTARVLVYIIAFVVVFGTVFALVR